MKNYLRGAIGAILTICIFFLAACGVEDPKTATATFQSMDTLMTLKVYGGEADLCSRLQERVEKLDDLLDATDENSEIAQLNTDGSAEVSDDTDYLLKASVSLCRDLYGDFDISVYPAMQAWGFTTGDYRVPDDDELKKLAEKINYGNIRFNGNHYSLDGETQIDLGAVAKGFAADECACILLNSNAQAAVLNLGGTIFLYGQKPDGSRFTVGVADPDNPTAYFGTFNCDQGIVATSGGYERYFEKDGKRYIHIIDPTTAKPVDNGILSVTILSEDETFQDGIETDALSTALFVMGLDKATEYYKHHSYFDFIILTDDHNVYLTEGIYDDFTLCDGYDFTLNKVS